MPFSSRLPTGSVKEDGGDLRIQTVPAQRKKRVNGAVDFHAALAELETAGKCLEWVKDHLALDEIDIFLEKTDVASSKESIFTSLYDYMSHVISKTPAGCGGVIFTPWLHGNRCPFEDPNARGMFFNISLETGKTELIRAVVEHAPALVP